MTTTNPKGIMEIANSPVIIASIISVISGFVLTQVIGPVIDHYKDKNYRLVERNLQLRKLMGDEFHNESLDELIRMQLNSYILISRTTERRSPGHRFIISVLGMLGIISFLTGIVLFFEENMAWSVSSFAFCFMFAILAARLRQKFYKTYTVENTKYKAVFLGGKFEGGHVTIDVMPAPEDGSPSTLDYPVLYLKDPLKGRIHVYSRVKSAGNISVGSGEETSMQTDYTHTSVLPHVPENIPSPAIVNTGDIKLPGEVIPIDDIALASVKPMRKIWSLIRRLVHRIARKNQTEETS